ncbi:amidohydrolase family protein [Actinomadura sp. CNU-125]|uniref:amidohydrolase family protein n=1 Tax=Actinomadura sp. CNU-125 TaxID=1904961 RepID=UPI0021CC7147|nr:amidohydrolase family protein [Actinomadura sp. CNU-125]
MTPSGVWPRRRESSSRPTRATTATTRSSGCGSREARRVRFWVTPFWEDDIDGLVGRVRVDRLLLGSDWPYAEGVVRPTDFVTDTLRGLAADQVRRISRDNALELLGLTARR